jgi:hypothetical protein
MPAIRVTARAVPGSALACALPASCMDFSTGPAYLTSTNVKTLGRYVNQTGY